jgi:hypothetical protein
MLYRFEANNGFGYRKRSVATPYLWSYSDHYDKGKFVADGKLMSEDFIPKFAAQLKKEFGTSERSEWSKTQLKKYERCVMDVKKGIKEGVNPVDVFIENEMDRMIESYTQPKITKSDLLAHLREQDAPTIKPVVKPGKPKDKPTRRDNPFVNPNPKVNPAPKANTETKPVVKPGKPAIKPTRRDNPFVNPNPKVNPPPKAISAKKAKDAIINNIMELINFEN